MFKDNRVYYASLGLALVAALLILHAVRSFDSYQVTHANERQCDTEYRTADAGQQIKAECAEIAARVAAHGVSDSKRAANRDQAPDYGLKAQQDMAEWAYAAQWAAVIGSIITGVGVIYVALTLYETRNAAAAANKAADAAIKANEGFALASKQQLTAYVLSEEHMVTQTWDKFANDKFTIKWSFKIRNTGQTPAYDVENICRCNWATKEEMDAWDLSAEPSSRSVFGPDRTLTVRHEFDSHFTDRRIAILLGLKETIWLKGVTTYRDINGRLWRHDYCLYLRDLGELTKSRAGEATTRQIPFYTHVVGNDLRMIKDPSAPAKEK